jgi:cell division transport system permease protein
MPSRKISKEEEKATAELSKERLSRITKTHRHAMRTNARVLKYGAKSFVRNTWLSIAAIAIMAVTLIVLSATLIATHAMGTVVNKIEQQVDMSIYLDQGTTDEQISKIVSRMTQLESVVEVTSTSPSEANKAAIEKILARSKDLTAKEKETYRQNLLDAPNKLPWTLNVKLVNLDNTQELEDFVNNDEDLKELLDKNNAPSYASERRDTIDKIAGTMNRVELIGLAAGGVFALIAILVVFNTLRMAIFNRKEEIYMMRLVGASRWFIVGPFVVEASIYGIIAAIIAGVIAYAGTFALQPQFGTTLDPTVEIMRNFWYLALCALLVAGILIGVISSLLATRKYLKQK